MPRPISDRVVEALEDGALEGIKHIRAFLTYQGNEAKYYQKAKAGGVLVGSYVKAVATQTNRMAIEQAAKRIEDRSPDVVVTEKRALVGSR